MDCNTNRKVCKGFHEARKVFLCGYCDFLAPFAVKK